MPVSLDEKQEEAEAKARELDSVKAALNGKTIVKVIYVPGRILNIVVK